MSEIAAGIGKTVLRIFYVDAVVFGPGIVTLLILMFALWRRQKGWRLPFTRSPLHFAGQSALEKASDLWVAFTTDLVVVSAVGPGVLVSLLLLPKAHSNIGTLIGLFVAAAIVVIFGTRANRKLRACSRYHLGALGEQVVGRELDELMAKGYRVFHDVQFDGWNIDHVVVGPRGVFAVETKTPRKPRKHGTPTEVILDGDSLIFSGRRATSKPIKQAIANASSLKRLIAEATGERVDVEPVVALPGWKLTAKGFGRVGVFSATNMAEPMLKRGHSQLDAGQIQRIAYYLRSRNSVDLPKN